MLQVNRDPGPKALRSGVEFLRRLQHYYFLISAIDTVITERQLRSPASSPASSWRSGAAGNRFGATCCCRVRAQLILWCCRCWSLRCPKVPVHPDIPLAVPFQSWATTWGAQHLLQHCGLKIKAIRGRGGSARDAATGAVTRSSLPRAKHPSWS